MKAQKDLKAEIFLDAVARSLRSRSRAEKIRLLKMAVAVELGDYAVRKKAQQARQ